MNKIYSYQVYGLEIHSNKKINQFYSSNRDAYDLCIVFKCAKWNEVDVLEHNEPIYKSKIPPSKEYPMFAVWKFPKLDHIDLVIRTWNSTSPVYFVYNNTSTELSIYYENETRFQDILTYLSGPVMGCILRMKEKIVLHASVVAINNIAVAFIGPKGAGKSSIIAAFAKAGYPIISDDLAVMVPSIEGYKVCFGYPRMRLLGEVINNVLDLDYDRLEPVLDKVNKYYVNLDTETNYKFHDAQLPLETIYFLNDRKEKGELSAINLSEVNSFMKLQSNTYAEYMLDKELLSKEFYHYGELLKNCKVKALDRVDDLSSLENCVQFILNDLQTLLSVSYTHLTLPTTPYV